MYAFMYVCACKWKEFGGDISNDLFMHRSNVIVFLSIVVVVVLTFNSLTRSWRSSWRDYI